MGHMLPRIIVRVMTSLSEPDNFVRFVLFPHHSPLEGESVSQGRPPAGEPVGGQG